MKTIEEILKDIDLSVVGFEKGVGGYSVRVSDKNSDFKAWIDVHIHDNDIVTEWNQYIFYLDNADDLRQRYLQDSAELFSLCCEKVEDYLIKIGEIEYSESGYKYLRK